MADNTNPLDALMTAAIQVRNQLKLTFDAEGAAELAKFIEAQRGTLPLAEREGVVTALGCFLGQCLIQGYGGEWGIGPDGSTGVGFDERLFFNPFYLVNEQLNKGEAASVAAFFASVPARRAAPPAPRKRWIS